MMSQERLTVACFKGDVEKLKCMEKTQVELEKIQLLETLKQQSDYFLTL